MQNIKNIKCSYANRHIPELDGIRGITILSVLIYHLFWFPSPGGGWTGIAFGLWKVAQLGWIGVNLFFVLSGFLISRILINQKDQPHYFRKFYFRRALRILPLYLLTLTFIYFHYENSGPFVFLNLAFLAHIPNLFGIIPCYPGLWSLSIEEQFYLVWPQLIRRLSLSQIRKGAFLICILSPVLRGLAFKFPALSAPLALFIGFDGFAYGALLAIAYEESRGTKNTLNLFSICCLGLASVALLVGYKFGIVTRQRFLGEVFLPSLIYLFATALMAYCLAKSGSSHLKFLAQGFLPQWGKLSYAAYLCHYPVPELTSKIFNLYPEIYSYYYKFEYALLQFGLSLAGTYLVSLLIHKWIETPFLKLKNREFVSSKKEYPQ